MNFPKFWARGTFQDFSCWRWSFQSLAEAQSFAEQAARQLAERYRRGPWPPKDGGGNYYPDRPAREQILREINDARGLSAVVTRNSYGSQVLNTARVMFVDIDLPEPPRPKFRFLKILFGRQPPAPPDRKPENDALARVETWTRDNEQWGWRAYRTRSGLRLLATQGTVEAESPTTDQIFEAMGADPLYRKLCKSQKCFRARLTPKPWRCEFGGGNPPRWPWDAREEKKFHKWEAKYNEASAEWATCEFVRQIGSTMVHPEVQSIIQLHDEATKVGSNLPLA